MPTQKTTITEKLMRIQEDLRVPKAQRNNFGKYNYRSCEDILNAVKPLAVIHRVAVIIRDEIVLIESRFYVKAVATITDGENEISATGFAREAETKKGMDSSQITGAASSYARKYALNGLFAIDDSKDSDTTNTGAQKTPEQKTNERADWFNPTNNAHKISLATTQKTTQKVGKILVAEMRKTYKISKADATKIESWNPKKPADTPPPPPPAPEKIVPKSWDQ